MALINGWQPLLTVNRSVSSDKPMRVFVRNTCVFCPRVLGVQSAMCKVQNEFRTHTCDTFHFAVFTLHFAFPIWLRPKAALGVAECQLNSPVPGSLLK
jgi:hypothetical protein